MLFFVKVTSEVPADFPEAERGRLISAERARVKELRDQGKIVAVWKVPVIGQSVSAWEVEDAVELHVLLMSLPAMAWANATVQPIFKRNQLPH